MISNIAPYVDGWIGPERPLTVKPRVEWPFKNNPDFPDTYTRVWYRDFEVPTSYVSRCGNRTAWTNLLLQSESFDVADWTKTNSTIDDDAGRAPTGDDTMDAVLETTTNGEHSVSQAATLTAVPWELSVFAKAGLTRSIIRLAFVDSATVTRYAFFDVLRGTIGSKSGCTAKIVPLGNGDFRCVIRLTPAAGAGTFRVNVGSTGTTISYAGTITMGIYLWGAQATIQGDDVRPDTPYISTTTTSRTILAPDRDPVDPFAYLIEEENPKLNSSEKYVVTRAYARIPRQQIIPNDRFITKPSLTGPFPKISGSSLIIQPEENVPRWVFYTRVPVTSDSGVPNGDHPTGGTYTITVGASTTSALAYNASAATLQSAINGLSSVSTRGTVTVTGSYTVGFTISFNAYTPGSVNVASLTGSALYVGASASVTIVNVIDMGFVITPLPSGASFTGGTFTVTIFGQTTAPIAYNATAADLFAAVSALSNTAGSTVRCFSRLPNAFANDTHSLLYLPNKIWFGIQVTPPAMSATGTSLTPTGSTAALASTSTSGLSYTLALTGVNLAQRVLFAAGHGFATTDTIILTQGTNYRTLAPGTFSVTTDTIVLTAVSGSSFTTGTTITEAGRSTGSEYTAGSKLTRIHLISNFYLIGVSADVDTIDDVPLPTFQGDDASLLAAIFNGSTEINFEVGQQNVWRLGPIIERTKTTLNATQL